MWVLMIFEPSSLIFIAYAWIDRIKYFRMNLHAPMFNHVSNMKLI